MKTITYIILLSAMIYFSGCTNAPEARRVLQMQGYTNIEITGYNFFTCSKNDFYSTGFTATTRDGNKVSGTICSGLFFKGSTVRF